MGLFHYTDLGGLKGILESKSLWATNIYYLNDRNEAVHGFSCFENTIGYLDKSIISTEKRRMLQNAVDASKYQLNQDENNRVKHIYNISFCLDSDKLSQWRGYGSHQGVCIEFDKDELIENIDPDNAQFNHGQVVYCSENNTVQMNESIISFFRKLKLRPEHMSDNFIWFAHSFEMINQITPFFKNEGFSEENEYRFIFTPETEMMNLKFRVNANGLIPYISVGMRGNDRLPIKKIIIGPTKEPNFIANGIRMLLSSLGYDKILIETSKVPYRG